MSYVYYQHVLTDVIAAKEGTRERIYRQKKIIDSLFNKSCLLYLDYN